MSIFFYAGSAGKQEQQFAEVLLQRTYLTEMIILPGGEELVSLLSLKLRSGDLLILCAASDASLSALLMLHNKFVDFRVILVLPRQDEELIRKSHLLRPRFTTFLFSDLRELDGVVEKMISH